MRWYPRGELESTMVLKLARLCGWAWIGFLAVVLLLAARDVSRLTPLTPEVAYGCDSFGYLTMAREIRHAAATAARPDFHLESRQTRLLIDHMKSQRVRIAMWDELVAPHAHHYFPRADQIGVQYPPGTGLALAVFPERAAVHRLIRTVAWSLLGAGWLALVWAGVRGSWVSAGLVVLALYLGLEVLVRLSIASFSIAAVLLPLLLACVLSLVAAAARGTSSRLAWVAALAAGSFLGAAMLVRIPSLVLLPALLVLLLPRSARDFVRGPAGALALGLAVFGVAPLLLHQSAVAGAWYLPTYNTDDASLPRLNNIAANLSYFLGGGPGAGEAWALLPALAGALGAFALMRLSRRGLGTEPAPLSWRRVALSAAVAWGVSTVFFVTHRVTTPYYNSPGTFAALVLLGFGLLVVESSSRPRSAPAPAIPASPGDRRGSKRAALIVGATALSLLPGIAVAARWQRLPLLAPKDPAPAPIVLPAELADERAWVYADMLTGSLWYYARKPAFKIQFSNDETRARLYRFAFERHDQQYILSDSDTIERFIDEIERLGGTLEPRGQVAGQPYFRIHWPEAGPADPATAGRGSPADAPSPRKRRRG